MAAAGMFYDPNVHLVFQNYFDHKDRFLGQGNYTEEGFAQMRTAKRLEGARSARAIQTKAHPTPNENEFGGKVELGRIGGTRWNVVRWETRWPGLMARGAWGGAVPSVGRTQLEAQVTWYTRILHYARSAEVVEIVGGGSND